MSVSVGNKMRQMAASGSFTKANLQAAAVSMLDGRGITKAEKASFTKAFREIAADPDVRVSGAVKDGYGALMDRMSHFSGAKQVFAPKLDRSEIRSILAVQVQARTSTPSYGGGEGASSAASSTPTPSYGGGEGASSGGYVPSAPS